MVTKRSSTKPQPKLVRFIQNMMKHCSLFQFFSQTKQILKIMYPNQPYDESKFFLKIIYKPIMNINNGKFPKIQNFLIT